jgi:membrane complex biogenesis BtpA family protein
MDAVLEAAARDAGALAEGGAAAVVVENFGSAPFPKAGSAPATVAMMAVAAARVREVCGLPVGVNVLRNDALAALGVAVATGAAFLRVNVLVGASVTDQGLIEGDARALLLERRRLGALHVAILADVRVKHAAPLAPQPLAQEIHDARARGGADGILVTGDGTGRPVDAEALDEARAAVGEAPLYVASGLTAKNAPRLTPRVDGAIVGTWLKEDGRVDAPVDPKRVARLAALCDFRRG